MNLGRAAKAKRFRCSRGHECTDDRTNIKTANIKYLFNGKVLSEVCFFCFAEYVNSLGLPKMEEVPDEPKPDVEIA